MSYVKIHSISDIKKDVTSKCRLLKQNGIEGYNQLLEKNLVELSKVIREEVYRGFSVKLFLYADEYTFNFASDKYHWTAGVDEQGLVNWVFMDINNQKVDKGSFRLGTEDEKFKDCLKVMNEKI